MRQVEQQYADEALREAVESTRWWRRSMVTWRQKYDDGMRWAFPNVVHAKGRMREAQGLARALCGVRWGGYLRFER